MIKYFNESGEQIQEPVINQYWFMMIFDDHGNIIHTADSNGLVSHSKYIGNKQVAYCSTQNVCWEDKYNEASQLVEHIDHSCPRLSYKYTYNDDGTLATTEKDGIKYDHNTKSFVK